MSSATDYLENQIGDHILRDATFTKPAALYIGLFTTLPSDDGTGGVEVSGGSYARVAAGPGNATWDAPGDGSGRFSNAGTITFPAPTANWGTVVGFGLFDASTAGNLLIYNSLSASKVVNSGYDAPQFSPDTLGITFA